MQIATGTIIEIMVVMVQNPKIGMCCIYIYLIFVER